MDIEHALSLERFDTSRHLATVSLLSGTSVSLKFEDTFPITHGSHYKKQKVVHCEVLKLPYIKLDILPNIGRFFSAHPHILVRGAAGGRIESTSCLSPKPIGSSSLSRSFTGSLPVNISSFRKMLNASVPYRYHLLAPVHEGVSSTSPFTSTSAIS
jgi:hypothetical protein